MELPYSNWIKVTSKKQRFKLLMMGIACQIQRRMIKDYNGKIYIGWWHPRESKFYVTYF